MHLRRSFPVCLVVTALAGAAVACDTNPLPPPTIANVEDTISLYALDGTPLTQPSGYNIQFRQVLRTDRDARFDFAFNITPTGQAVLLPTGALQLGRASGILPQSVPFESVKTAPSSGYTDTTFVGVDSGAVAVVRSRPSSCLVFSSVVHFYGKVQVLQIDTVARRIDLRVLVDQNCGYRDLEPGLPRQ